MKRRVGTLYKTPIVEGDANIVTQNEILVKKDKSNLVELKVRSQDGLENITSDSNKYWKAKGGGVSESELFQIFKDNSEAITIFGQTAIVILSSGYVGSIVTSYGTFASVGTDIILTGIADFGVPCLGSDRSLYTLSNAIGMIGKENFETLFEECSKEEWYNLIN